MQSDSIERNIDNPVTIQKNCTALLAYYDIFKNYYANKQEENFYTIAEYAWIENDIYISSEIDKYVQKTTLGSDTFIGIETNSPIKNILDNIVISTSLNNVYINYQFKGVIDSSVQPSEQTWTINGKQVNVTVYQTPGGNTEQKNDSTNIKINLS